MTTAELEVELARSAAGWEPAAVGAAPVACVGTAPGVLAAGVVAVGAGATTVVTGAEAAPAAGAVAVAVAGAAVLRAGVLLGEAGTGMFRAGPPSAAPAAQGSASAALRQNVAASAHVRTRTCAETLGMGSMRVGAGAGKAQAGERVEGGGEDLLG